MAAMTAGDVDCAPIEQMSVDATVGSPLVLEQANQWSTGMCDCCKDPMSMLESVLCSHCQIARQYNRIFYNGTGACTAPLFLSIMLDGMFGLALSVGRSTIALAVRRQIRSRYGIEGNACLDALSAWFCTSCVTAQHYREMSIRGDWPGGTFVHRPYLAATLPCNMAPNTVM